MKPELHLVLGDGVIGLAVADELQRLGRPHALASRQPPAEASHAAPHRRTDALDLPQLLAATADATHVHVTLGLAYQTAVWQRDWPRIAENLVQAARRHGFRIVFFDNVYPYGPTPLQVPMTEEHPQRPVSRKGQIRKAVDDRLMRAAREDGVPVLIARCADFYGPGVRNSMLYMAGIERQLRGKAAQCLGNPDLPHSLTYTLDAARGLVRLALDDGAYGQAWHLPTASPAPTMRAMLVQSARLLGAPELVQVMPRPMIGVLGLFVPVLREVKEMLYQNEQPYVFSSARFMQRYPDFRVTPYAEGLLATIRSFRPERAELAAHPAVADKLQRLGLRQMS
jgi:nucleoside-diphosphate-sugar epimerase